MNWNLTAAICGVFVLILSWLLLAIREQFPEDIEAFYYRNMVKVYFAGWLFLIFCLLMIVMAAIR